MISYLGCEAAREMLQAFVDRERHSVHFLGAPQIVQAKEQNPEIAIGPPQVFRVTELLFDRYETTV